MMASHGEKKEADCTDELKVGGVVEILSEAPPFFKQLHIEYLFNLGPRLDLKTSYEGAVTEHLRVSGVYWTITALFLLIHDDATIDSRMKLKTDIVDWVYTCYDPTTGGFGGNTDQDGHLLYTLSAMQVLALAGCTVQRDDTRLVTLRPNIIQFVCNLQKSDGSFAGDKWGEIDTRFTYCALSILSLLGALDEVNEINNKVGSGTSRQPSINVRKAAQYIMKCRNLDGGFGSCIGAESHAGQVFCCIGALAIAKSLDLLVPTTTTKTGNDTESCETFSEDFGVDDDPCGLLGWWLSERQCDSGGLNGRPEKQADVCYSWWILSVLSILGKISWINKASLGRFILKCQDNIDGGIADRPNDMPDAFHTFFGIAGLSLLGYLHRATQPPTKTTIVPTTSTNSSVVDNSASTSCGIFSSPPTEEGTYPFREIDPIYALPTTTVRGMKLQGQVLAHRNEQIDSRLCHYEALYIE